jgi:hypothetical protein
MSKISNARAAKVLDKRLEFLEEYIRSYESETGNACGFAREEFRALTQATVSLGHPTERTVPKLERP